MRLSPGHAYFLAVETRPVPHLCGLNRPAPCSGNAPIQSVVIYLCSLPAVPLVVCSSTTHYISFLREAEGCFMRDTPINNGLNGLH